MWVTLNTRTRLLGMAAAGCLLAGSLAPVASALPSSSIDMYYYSSPAKTKLVGSSHLGCQGGFHRTGKVTAYYDYYDTPCE